MVRQCKWRKARERLEILRKRTQRAQHRIGVAEGRPPEHGCELRPRGSKPSEL